MIYFHKKYTTKQNQSLTILPNQTIPNHPKSAHTSFLTLFMTLFPSVARRNKSLASRRLTQPLRVGVLYGLVLQVLFYWVKGYYIIGKGCYNGR